MLTDREKALLNMVRNLTQVLLDYRETGCVSSDVYASTEFDVAEQSSDDEAAKAIDRYMNAQC